MKHTITTTRKEIIRYWTGFLVAAILIAALLPSGKHALAANDVGYKDFFYSSVSAPTGQRPQSKLWFNDGIWWGSLYNSARKRFEIYRFDWTANTWATTGTLIDTRYKSSGDALWDGSHLYVMSAVPPGTNGDTSIRLMRYSYNSATKTYSVDTGFPVNIISRAVEVVVMEKDSQGKLWLTYTFDDSSTSRSVYVSHTTTNDLSWITPYVIPLSGANNLSSDDISAIISFDNQIGVMWSNQNTDSVNFGIHQDGDSDSAWTANPAVQGPKYADDHINIKSLTADPSGRVYAAIKTSLNDINPPTSSQPVVLLLRLDHNGSWTRRTIWRVSDRFTRPIVLIDTQNRNIYAFAAQEYPNQTSGAIFYKQIPLDDPGAQFETGVGSPFIVFSTDTHINNPSSTKQNLNSTTGLLVIASDDTSRYYFHNKLTLGSGQPTATSTPTSTPTDTPTNTPTATETPLPTATPTGAPTDTPTSTPTSAVPTDTPTPTQLPVDTPTPTATNTPLPIDTPTPTPTSLPLLFSDGFESGDFSAWSTVRTGGDGVALVQSGTVKTGSFAAQLSETANTGSLSYIRASLSSSQTEVKIGLDILISQEGASGGNVPVLRLFDSSGTRLISLYRQNLSGNRIWINHSGSSLATTGLLSLNTWSHFDVRVITAGTGASTIEVHQDGILIYQTSSASLGTSGILTVQVGNETAKQAFTLFADNVQISR